jgi:phytoene/squalene synthetase
VKGKLFLATLIELVRDRYNSDRSYLPSSELKRFGHADADHDLALATNEGTKGWCEASNANALLCIGRLLAAVI